MTPDHIVEAIRFQAKACENLGSPFMGQLMRLFGERDWPAGPIRDRIFAWEGDISPAGQSIPLRLAGALHALHLADEPLLAEVYPPAKASDDALWQHYLVRWTSLNTLRTAAATLSALAFTLALLKGT